jgi:hypothetical protein
MTDPHKTKGDRAEREAAGVLAELLGGVRRQLGAGRADDVGDLVGVPGCAVQVADWQDLVRALRVKVDDAERQAARSGLAYGVAMLRIRGGTWRVAMSPATFCALLREATVPAGRTVPAPPIEATGPRVTP